jgi:two-component system, OmpR family, response regulator PrrA
VNDPTIADPVRVLVVDDDDGVRDALVRGLALHGFRVEGASDADAAQRAVQARPPQVVVLDVGMPGRSGIELCAEFRASGSDLPVLILSARDQVDDRIAGLEAGADDYLVKPFDLTELVLRLRALHRRAPAARSPGSQLVVGPLTIDENRRLVTLGTVPLELSRREFDLLAAFARHAGAVLSRGQLLEQVWGYDFDGDANVVDVFVGYLRRKFEAAGGERMIDTVRGVGYVLRAG